MFVLEYTAVRVGELLRDPKDHRWGVWWEELSLEDGSMDVYRKKQQWDAVSLPNPVISPLRSYRKLMDPPTECWLVFPTFDQRTLATLVQDELGDRGIQPDVIDSDVASTLVTCCWRLKSMLPHRHLRRMVHVQFFGDSRTTLGSILII